MDRTAEVLAANLPADSRTSPSGRAKPLAIALLAAVWATALWLKFPFITGPSYLYWWYQKIPPGILVPTTALASLSVLLAVWGYGRNWWGWKVGMGMLMAGVVALMLATSWVQPESGGWERAARIIRSPLATSAGAQALRFHHDRVPINQWLAHYPELMPELYSHCQTRGPGNVLLQAMLVEVFGTSWKVSYGAAVLIAVLAALGVLATFGMVRALTGDEQAGFLAAAFLGLCPGFILVFPAMDEVYPLVTCGLAWLCFQVWRTQKHRHAIALGVLMAVALLCTYVLLVLGVFVVGSAWIGLRREKRFSWVMLLRRWALVLVSAAGFYGMLYLATGFNALATVRMAMHMQKAALGWIHRRPYPQTILFDQTDFALGSGWISVLILIFALWGLWRRKDPRLAIVLLCLAQIEAVAISGLTPGETARLWCFLLPLLVLPVGLELRHWDAGARLAVFVSLWAILTVTCGRLIFVAIEPLDKLPPWVVTGR